MNIPQVDRIEIEATARQYVGGRMSKDEEAQFETRMLLDPRIVNEVEITRRMRVGLQQLRRSNALDLVTPARLTLRLRVQLAAASILQQLHAAAALNFVTLPRLTLRSRAQLTAAGVMVVLAATALYYGTLTPSSNILAASADALPGFGGAYKPASYVLADRRTADDGIVIPKPNQHAVIQLDVLPVHPNAAGGYQVELRHAGAASASKPLARIEAGSADQVFIPVFLNTSELETGRYVLTVIAPETSGQSPATTRYTFTLTATP